MLWYQGGNVVSKFLSGWRWGRIVENDCPSKNIVQNIVCFALFFSTLSVYLDYVYVLHQAMIQARWYPFSQLKNEVHLYDNQHSF